MTLHDTRTEIPGAAALKARFRPVFDRIAEGALRRERERILPVEEIGWRKESGFTALRVPVDDGGAGGRLSRQAAGIGPGAAQSAVKRSDICAR